MDVVILGCGYTGQRLAERLSSRGARVICTNRNPEKLRAASGVEVRELDVAKPFTLDFVPKGSLVLHSIPPVEKDDPTAIPRALADLPSRVVYLSTTGVYGSNKEVSHLTEPAPRSAADQQRINAEAAIQSGPWSSMILRPAAIYGPGRGVHVSLAEGRYQLVDGGCNYVSRIHVDDLAAHAEAALLSDLSGAWPVADDHPCTSREIAEYCAALLGVPMPESVAAAAVHRTRRADRKVDGSAVRSLLGIDLLYPSYRQGIPASMALS
jgi:nucleoside-diphosphate-sugar epimerase